MLRLVWLAALLLSCGEPPGAGPASDGPAPSAPLGGKADDAREAPGVAVALVLSSLDPSTADLPAADLLGLTSRTGGRDVSVDLRAAALGASATAAGRLVETGEGTLRVDRIALGAGLGPGRATWNGRPLILPLRLAAHGDVEIARLFASNREAERADMPSLADLPFSASAALALPEGTVVSFPVEARLAVNADGRLVHALSDQDARFGRLARASMLGQTSAVAQGLLVLEGRSTVRVVRLTGTRVRLFLRAGASAEVAGSASVRAGATLRATFLPGDVLDRARALRRALDAGRMALSAPEQAVERLERFSRSAPLATRRLLDLAPGVDDDPFEARAMATVDRAVDLASDLARPLDELDAEVLHRLQTPLAAGAGALERLERIAVRSLDLAATLSLQMGRTTRLGAVGDFEIDLADAEAAAAYERAVNGRVRWLGPVVSGLETGSSLLDLTTLDALAEAPVDPERPAVLRRASAASDLRERRFGLHLETAFLRTGFAGTDAVNRVEVTAGDGSTQTWAAHLWARESSPGFGQDAHQSGFFAPVEGETASAAYFFGWRRDFGPFEPEPVRRALAESVNLLGRRSGPLGIPALYQGERPGAVRVALDVVVTGEALAVLFDPARTTPTALWRALGTTAETWDNQFGLPYLASTRRPAVVDSLPEAAEACESVAAAWGGRWCLFFAETFLPALEAARATDGPVAAMQFLERFYRAGLLANPVGSRLLVRYLSEVLYEVGENDGLHVRLDVRNATDASTVASPSLRVGAAPAGALVEALGVSPSP